MTKIGERLYHLLIKRNELVILHDSTFDRTTSDHGAVAKRTSWNTRTVDAGQCMAFIGDVKLKSFQAATANGSDFINRNFSIPVREFLWITESGVAAA